MLNATQQNSYTWRDNWLVKNVLSEIPIIGSFFSKKTCYAIMRDAGKCAAMFVGGATSMMTLLTPTEVDSMSMKMTKVLTSMGFGMMAGKVIYNSVYSGVGCLYQYVSERKRTTASLETCSIETAERQSLNAPATSTDP